MAPAPNPSENRINVMTKNAFVLLLVAGLTGVGFAGPGVAQDSGIPAGTAMPGTDIALVDGSGTTTLGAERGRVGTVVVFWSNRCPWGTKLEGRLTGYIRDYSDDGVAVVLINSNDTNAFAKENASENSAAGSRIGAKLLGDTTSRLATAFGVTRNPAFFLFDSNHTLVYSGSFDDSPGDAAAVNADFLNQATQALLSNSAQPTPGTKAFGCMINPARS
jgi:hypothetical protein